MEISYSWLILAKRILNTADKRVTNTKLHFAAMNWFLETVAILQAFFISFKNASCDHN